MISSTDCPGQVLIGVHELCLSEDARELTDVAITAYRKNSLPYRWGLGAIVSGLSYMIFLKKLLKCNCVCTMCVGCGTLCAVQHVWLLEGNCVESLITLCLYVRLSSSYQACMKSTFIL